MQFPWTVSSRWDPVPAPFADDVDELAERFLSRSNEHSSPSQAAAVADHRAGAIGGVEDQEESPGKQSAASPPASSADAARARKLEERKRRLTLLASQERAVLREAQARAEEQNTKARLFQLQQLRDAPQSKPAVSASREHLEAEVRRAAAEERERLAALIAQRSPAVEARIQRRDQEGDAASVDAMELCGREDGAAAPLSLDLSFEERRALARGTQSQDAEDMDVSSDQGESPDLVDAPSFEEHRAARSVAPRTAGTEHAWPAAATPALDELGFEDDDGATQPTTAQQHQRRILHTDLGDAAPSCVAAAQIERASEPRNPEPLLKEGALACPPATVTKEALASWEPVEVHVDSASAPAVAAAVASPERVASTPVVAAAVASPERDASAPAPAVAAAASPEHVASAPAVAAASPERVASAPAPAVAAAVASPPDASTPAPAVAAASPELDASTPAVAAAVASPERVVASAPAVAAVVASPERVASTPAPAVAAVVASPERVVVAPAPAVAAVVASPEHVASAPAVAAASPERVVASAPAVAAAVASPERVVASAPAVAAVVASPCVAPALTRPEDAPQVESIKLLQVVKVQGEGGKFERAQVQFVGPVEFAAGIWVGVVLGAPIGKNDGSVKGKRYFTCDAKYGLMVPVERVSPWDARAVSPQRVISPVSATAAHVNRLKKAQQQRQVK